MLAIYSFSSAFAADGHREAEVTLKIHSSSLDRLCATNFFDPSPLLRFRPILWVPLG